MATSRTKKPPRSKVAAADAALIQTDLGRWAGKGIARAGRRIALLGQVEALRLVSDGRTVEASVRDTGPLPYRVRVLVAGGSLVSRCTCGHEGGPCKHGVATVEALRFPRPDLRLVSNRGRSTRKAGRIARGRGRIVYQPPRPQGWVLTRDERLALARKQELQDRRTRARKAQAPVRRVSGKGGPPRFRVGGSEPEAPYTVVLRGNKFQLGSCTCPDFAKSELATCKHVERARNWFSKRRKRVPKQVLSVWWQPREWMKEVPDPLREIRVDAPGGEPPEALGLYFDVDGWLRPPPNGAGSTWAAEAREAAHRTAAERGWTLDVDPAVGERIETARGAETRAAALAAIDRDGEPWRRIVPRLGLKLHPYQEHGALFLARRGRAFLADDMGLGKTVQAIAAALLLRDAAGVAKALVVCPASLKHQWRREIEKTCGETAEVMESGRAERLAAYRAWSRGFLVLNYELVLRDLDAIRRAAPDLIILDEAQRIKNWETKTAKAVKRLESAHAFILTGTPLENRLVELHSLVEFLHPRALGPRWRLFPFHAVTDPEERVLAYEGLDVLRHRLESFFLRRERATVLDQLPARTDNTFWTGMTTVQRRVYRKQAARIARLVARRQALGPADIRALLQGLTVMRILCNAWAQHVWESVERRLLDPSPASPAEVRALHSPKLEEFARVMEDLLDESSSKIVVFSQWERMLRLAQFTVRELLERRGERAGIFHGGLDGRARHRILEGFREDPGFRVLLSTDAGGLGLNLQDSASIVVNLEVPWNPAVLEQRIGRVHRMGQSRGVQVLHFVTRETIEERVRQVVEAKRALFEGLLVDELDRVVIDRHGRASLFEQVHRLISNGPESRGVLPETIPRI